MPPKGKGKGKAKSKQTHRKTTASASNPDAAGGRVFPSEVISNILSRLPVKTLLRFKCVSKQWRSLASLPRFISRHLSHSPASLIIHAHTTPIPAEEGNFPQPRLQPDGHVIYAYGPPNPQSNCRHPPSTVDRILDFPGSDAAVFDRLVVIGSPNGIVCIVQHRYSERFTLWNPATRSSLPLPSPVIQHDPNIHRAVFVGLGFDPSRNDYKIIRVTSHHDIVPDQVEILSVKRGRWKTLEKHESRMVLGSTCIAVIKGVPYWRSLEYDAAVLVERELLVSFDVRKDVFQAEEYAWIATRKSRMFVGEMKDCLGAVVWDGEQVLDVWMKEDGSGWSKKYTIEGFPGDGTVVGFYGERGIVAEVGGEGNLSMLNLDHQDMVEEDMFNVQDSLGGTISVVSCRESLTRMPRLGELLI